MKTGIFTSAVMLVALAGAPGLGQTLTYNRDIRPIFSENCFPCHGFDQKARKAKLRLDIVEGAYAERDGVTPIHPGDLEKSEVWYRVMTDDVDDLMPPPDSHLELTKLEKEKIKAWIEQGAQYEGHWAFVPPERPPVPSGRGKGNAIDRFIRQRLAEEKLPPSPEAERWMLIRRLSLDLTGLPPSAEEVEAFVMNRGKRAYEALVDRLMESPHFGERLALDWLDAARYADSNGFSIDGGRDMWLWRDWVIQAFNDNKPYDQFLVAQIAGDLLPERSDADLIATGFQRNNMVTHEGGTIPAENLTNYNADRVKTLGESILGLTLGCAQCHDHKFDPVTQKDYYQLFAFFNTLGDRGLDGNGGVNPRPSFKTKTVLKTDEVPGLRRRIGALRERLADANPAFLTAWEERQRVRLRERGRDLALHPVRVLKVSTPNRGGGFEAEGVNGVRLGNVGGLVAFDISTRLPEIPEPITGLRVVVRPVAEFPGGGWGRGTVPAPGADPEDEKKGTFVLTAVSISADVVPGDQVNLSKLEPLARLTASSWNPNYPPANCLDPRRHNGWSPDISSTGSVHLTATLAEPIDSKERGYLTVQVNFGQGGNRVPRHVELFAMTGKDDGIDLPPGIISIIETLPAKRTGLQREELWTFCAAHAEELQRDRVELKNLEDRLNTLTANFQTMVMSVAEKPRDTFILARGDYSKPTVKVSPGTIAALPPMPDGLEADRLGLARWITMRSNPLTARVAVNRFWKLLFGTGIVATPADFGSQGEWPSHPALLDWLAVEFMDSGWDVKHLVKLIVMSRTYRQTSAVKPDLLERDPQNRLLARGPRFRLSAELVRDSALRVSGLLVPRIGGPSVNPYTPGDLWREVSHYGSTPATAQAFVQDHGEKLYRRSLYTFWKRTAPPPNMTAFDAPNREVCTVTRGATTTPLQALVTLNDPQFVEAGRAFAERILRREGSDQARLDWAMRAAVSRAPTREELKVLSAALDRERQRYAADAAAARAALSVGESAVSGDFSPVEHAAWMQVATLLLNLSESVTRN